MLNACSDLPDDDVGGISSITLNWTPPTEYEDNLLLPAREISSYPIYHGTDQTALDNHIEVNANTYMNSYTLNYNANTIENTTTYYAAMATVTNSGFESSLSKAVRFYSN